MAEADAASSWILQDAVTAPLQARKEDEASLPPRMDAAMALREYKGFLTYGSYEEQCEALKIFADIASSGASTHKDARLHFLLVFSCTPL